MSWCLRGKRKATEGNESCSSPSLPPVAFENPLLPLASYDDDEDDEDDGRRGHIARQKPRSESRAIEIRRDCPYLDTVNRQVLDFDFEKFCSVSLTNLNVFTQEQVEQLDKSRQWSRALDGSDYLPGTVGLNNIKETDFVSITHDSIFDANLESLPKDSAELPRDR
ncbi:hypothetical protein HAX54_019487 [Datura stramonium]|uniref:Uncharacterized protein n=1 Tax=Datura stramonium TaxID=4076 RepID=A0ABS8S1S2_DATST|nr:hypothetical protein [Datura stramonium]